MNVLDRYKSWTVDLIREDVQKHTFPYAVCMEQWLGDFNFSTLVRNANAFGAKEVFYIGKKTWDRRGSVGTHHYTSVNYLKGREELQELILGRGYIPVAVDCVDGSVSMEDYDWPTNPLMIFGEEQLGITSETLAICTKVVHITQYGSVRSLNAGVASGIAMFDFVRKFQREGSTKK